MKSLTCASTGRRLQAYHDGELSVSDQIDVDAHLEWCEQCAANLEEMRLLRSALRGALPGRQALVLEGSTNLPAAVVSRLRAEETQSWSGRMRAMFDDMHMVYAGLGAGTATVVCVMILLSMMRFANSERSPGSNQNPVVVDARTMMPRPLDQVLMTASDKDGDEGVFTLSAVVTREGRVVNLELHGQDGATLSADSSEARALESLLGLVAKARFEPAKVSGLPVAVNMVWMVAHTTVRAAKSPLLIENSFPAARKRRVAVTDGSARPILRPDAV
jgi:hypothetical protein